MTRSLVITIASACVMRLQLWPALFRAWDITTKPAPSAVRLRTSGALPVS